MRKIMAQINTKSNYFGNWQNNRIKFMLDKYGSDFFKDKKILELGSFNGYIGNFFQKELGADVTCVEGRFENVMFMYFNYPNLKIIQKNMDSKEWDLGKFDIIINFGLYYHLEFFHKEHMENCINNCDLMFFESVIYDSFEPEIYFRQESGNDQSLSAQGGNPSTSYVENMFKENNCKFTKYSDSVLNGELHHYDWSDLNSKKFDLYARRFWIVEN